MESCLREQEDIAEKIIKAYANYKKSPKDRKTLSYMETRLEALEKLWEQFITIHTSMVKSTTKEQRAGYDYFREDYYVTVEESYFEYKAKLKDDMRPKYSAEPRKQGMENQPLAPGCDVKLPRIQLPTFSGSYEEWQTFCDMFVSLIDKNISLSAVQKLHYLKGSLTGEPQTLLKNLSITDANYEEAWSQLTKRYNNKRYNANEIMKRLFGQKCMSNESASAVKSLLDTTSACLKSLGNIGVDTASWDTIIIHLIASKLDSESRKQWEIHVSQTESDDLPTWSQLTRFMETRFRTLEMIDGSKGVSKPSHINSSLRTVTKQRSFHSTFNNEEKKTTIQCGLCSGAHLLYQCKQFGKQSPQQRSEYVQSNRLCFNCLAPTHSFKNCHQSTSCRKCGRRHHTLLHIERELNQDSSAEIQSVAPSTEQDTDLAHKQQPEKRVVAHFAKENNQSKMLLATAMVKIKSASGYSRIVRALIDQGSEASFVTETTAQSLGLERVPINGLVSGIGDGEARTKSFVSFSLESLRNPKFSVQVNAYVLSKLTSFLPSTKVSLSDWSDIDNLPLADPKYGLPGKIDVILGVDIYSEIISEGLVKHPSGHGPIAQNTHLGWILSGGVVNQNPESINRVINLHVKEDQLLKQFWEIEREPDSIQKRLTKEEIKCEDIYEKSTTRDDEGRYVVRLPFTSSSPECFNGRSHDIALRRFQLLEKRLLRDPVLHNEYRRVMQDYIDQNHMAQITRQEEIQDQQVVYLPHHAVIREDKQTSKLRVVFDASCKGVNNVSLNDNLLVGPKLQPDLRHILMRWRRHAICIVADLVQMYRQIRVLDQDTDCQRILWRSNENQLIQHYRHLRLTFGTACAPYLAVKSLQQLAKDEATNYPVAAKITLEDYYMDDLLTGCDTQTEAIEIYEQMNSLMDAGGFRLQKWCSNNENLLDHIKKEKQGTDKSITFKTNDSVKVLGISWNKNSDYFEYTLQLPSVDEKITKRKVLSDIARLYDPMGWIAPVIISAKIYIQKLWKSGLSWDDPLTAELLKEWLRFKDDLSNVHNIIIPRWLETTKDNHVELHAFADASQAAYAAAVYIRTEKDGKVSVKLVTAKTKVSPIEKEVSIPRLELCAALLATKLMYEVSQVMQVPKEDLYAWSDSTVVLTWLRGEPSHWTTFVSNRVSEILTMLNQNQWNHVRTNYNPADCASRGMSIAELANYDLWWHGPDWLRLNDDYKISKTDEQFTTQEEKRPLKVFVGVIPPNEDFVWNRFSSLLRLMRVLSYCRRVLSWRSPKEQRLKLSNEITVQEMNEVLQICIKETQNLHFGDDLNQVKSHGCVPKKSQLHTLTPILDEKGVLRVGGRIHQAQEHFEKRHPIILPSESHITKLIIWEAHIKTLHGGPQLMLNYLRSKYWILRARNLVKKCYRECKTCIRYSTQNRNPFMGQIPKARLRPAKPFENAGVDFTGHINIRFSPGRGSKSYKGYICLFVCMTSKAVHLEAVSDLTSKGFIAAFRRFVSRRGHCKHLYSDNGTNFVGADRELREMLNKAVSKLPNEISQVLANEGTTWHFIPPHAPNFGGLWEAGVRSTKTHLKRVIGDSTLTYEELSTVLAQIEACLNSRPLSHMSDNPDDPLPLTPGHFIVGEPLVVIPDEDYETCNITGLQRWKLTQKMVNDFWRKWSDEYLVTLNQRYKWTKKTAEPDLNDIVIIRDHNLPPAKWLLGKIVEKHTGKDGVTRVVTIKTKQGLCKRPCNKLCFLPKD